MRFSNKKYIDNKEVSFFKTWIHSNDFLIFVLIIILFLIIGIKILNVWQIT
jgi:hypothetical protein